MNRAVTRVLLPLCTLMFAILLVSVCPARATIHYDVSLAQQSQHRFQVRMIIPNAGQGTVIAIPAWNALYQVRDFAYRVRDVQATAVGDDAQPASLHFD